MWAYKPCFKWMDTFCPFASVWHKDWLARRPIVNYYISLISNHKNQTILIINNEINTFLSVSICLMQSLVGTITTGLLLPSWPLRIILSCAFPWPLFSTHLALIRSRIWGNEELSLSLSLYVHLLSHIPFFCIFPDRCFISDLSFIFDLSSISDLSFIYIR